MPPVNRYQHIDVEPLTPSIGAEVRGVRLSQLSDAEFREIHRAFLDRLVLIFRDQVLTREQHKAFGRRFGDLHIHPGKRHLGLPGDPEIFDIKATPRSRFANGEIWHSDLSCEPQPPLGSALYLSEPPDCGGDTLFCNMYDVYDALSDPMKRFISGLHAFHDGRQDLAGYDVRLRPDQTYPSSTHPVVTRHPETGRSLLFVNPAFTVRIEELSSAESDSVLRLLYQHTQTQTRSQCRVRWTPNTLALWDNRCAQHHAIWDYFPRTRSGERVTIAGSAPEPGEAHPRPG